MKHVKHENIRIISTLQEHAMKINASNKFPSNKHWMLQLDTTQYPILMAYHHTTEFERFTPILSQITLGGDKIVDIK